MMKVSATIITYNEEEHIAACIDSLYDIVDEVIVIDSFSKDNTENICQKYEKVRFEKHPFEGHVQQKNYAIDRATHDIILSLDADERVSEELCASIEEAKKDWKSPAYSMNRLNNYGGKWIKTCGLYPDRKIRLFEKSKGRWGGTNPHDQVILENGVTSSHLKGDLLHYSFKDTWDHLDRSIHYAKIMGDSLYHRGVKPSWFKRTVKPIFRFIRDYFFRLGFTEGRIGFYICMTTAYATYLKYHALSEIYKAKD